MGTNATLFLGLFVFVSGAIYAIALVGLSSLAKTRGAGFLTSCRRGLAAVIACLLAAFLVSVVIYRKTQLPTADLFASSLAILLFALILVMAAFSRVESWTNEEAGEEG